MSPTAFHRRMRLRRRGGNQWYRDRSKRAAETVCGVPVTEFDITHCDRGRDWTRESDGRRFVFCSDCQKATP